MSFLGSLFAAVATIHNVKKDKGVNAQQTRVLEQARIRTDFWKSRIDIQTKTLVGERLEEAKNQATEAIDRIHKEANENLSFLSSRQSLLPVIGVPMWKKRLLLYEPIDMINGEWQLYRTMYWGFLLMSLEGIYVAVKILNELLSLPSNLRAKFLNDLINPNGIGKLLLLVVLTEAACIYSVVSFYRLARSGRKSPRLKEVDQI